MVLRWAMMLVVIFGWAGAAAGQTAPGTSPKADTIYPSPAGVKPSDLYEVAINGQAAFVYACHVGDIYDAQGHVRKDPPETTTPQPAAFCSFDMGGPVDIKVRVKGSAKLQSATIRPLHSGIEAAVSGDSIAFRIAHPGQYSVEVNGSPVGPLLLFANPPEVNVPRADDPKVLYFGPGEHVIGWKSVKAGQNVYLAPGAVVYGHLIVGGADGTKIYGRGILDSSRSPRKGSAKASNEFGRDDVQMHIGHCKNVLIEGITLLDSPTWTMHILESTDTTIRNVKIISWRENGDGIDINNSQRIHVENCFLRTWDDALVVKATLGLPRSGKAKARDAKWTPADLPLYPPGLTRDITFENCVIWLDRAHALEIGFETNGTEIANIAYHNIDIIHDNSLSPIDITNGDRAHVHHIEYEHIRIEDSHADSQIHLLAGKCYTSIDYQMGLDYGVIEDVSLRDIEFTGTAKPRVVLEGQSIDPAFKGFQIKDVVLQDMKINGKPAKESDLSIESKGLVAPVRFGG